MAKELKATLAFVSVPSDDPGKSADFYGKLFGEELARSLWNEEGYHAPISDDGIDLNIAVRHSPQEGTTPFIGVKNLQQAIDLAQAAGGRVVWGPEDLPLPPEDLDEYKKAVKEVDGLEVKTSSVGRAAILVDPGGSQVGLVQLDEHTHKHYAVGKHYRPLSDYREKVHKRSLEVAAKRRGRGRGGGGR